MPELNTREIIGKPLGRTFIALDRAADISTENDRVVENISLATETPIYQWFGAYVILDHSPSSIRMKRMEQIGPALWHHNSSQHLGRWLNVRVTDARELAADCKFSRGPLGEEKLGDVKDNILRTTSVGFAMWDLTPELDPNDSTRQMMIDGVPVFRCMDWEPLEGSWEPISADFTGVEDLQRQWAEEVNAILQRSATERNSTTPEERTMPNENENPTPANPANPAAPVVETRTVEQLFADNRLAAARTVSGWRDVMPTRSALIDQYLDSVPANVMATEIGMREFITANEQPSQTVPGQDPAAAAKRNGGGNDQPLELARSMSRAGAITAFDRGSKEANLRAAYNTGSWALATIFRGLAKDRDDNPINNGIFEKATRYSVENGLITRALSEGNNAKGGHLVPDEISNDIIDLMLKYGVARSEANVVQMKGSDLYIPRFVSGPDVAFVNESQEINESELVIDQVGVFAKKLAALVVWSTELDEDAVIDIGNMVADKAARAFAKREDECLFLGTGSSYYGGMVGLGPALTALGGGTIGNVAGVQVGSGNAYSELTKADFVGVLARQANFEGASPDRMKWYMSTGFFWNVAVNLLLAAGGNAISDLQNPIAPRFLGYPVVFVNVLPSIEASSQYVAFFGDMKAAVTMGVRRGFTFNESTEMRFKYDDIVGKATERFGLTVHSIGNSSATAADRLAGPMTALITAAS